MVNRESMVAELSVGAPVAIFRKPVILGLIITRSLYEDDPYVSCPIAR
jgi:hypothetical protein